MLAIERLMTAIEAFTDAKIDYARRYRDDPNWASPRDVDETREHLLECLKVAIT